MLTILLVMCLSGAPCSVIYQFHGSDAAEKCHAYVNLDAVAYPRAAGMAPLHCERTT